ncbi:glycosyltransferase [Alteromonas gracilis]|uniref:glycosyltransferase n=1 Tax=Alteromonas gracilis TaxID=1479524 RepID=UPI00321ACED2
MKSNPFISFVLPTRDRPDLIYKCLSFLKAQECEDFEVIIADNSVVESCEEKVACFLKDTRFQYKKAPSSLSMPDNWDFAIENAVGEYITVINEKFMFHPKAVGYIKSLSSKYELPDILSWQFEHFILSNSNPHLGDYHPLLKTVEPELYSAVEELERRFSFKEPLFSRHTQEKNGYGKIYSGAVKRGVVQKVKQVYGRVFLPMSPDFTSMVCFLNLSEVCLDLGRCLMLVVA